MMDVSAFLSGLDQMATQFERAVEQAIDESAKVALESMQGTTSFQNRSGSLRAAFRMSPESGVERAVFVDPSATGVGKTPPSTYARFLEFGTVHIDPRAFGQTAQHQAETAAVFIADAAIGEAIG